MLANPKSWRQCCPAKAQPTRIPLAPHHQAKQERNARCKASEVSFESIAHKFAPPKVHLRGQLGNVEVRYSPDGTDKFAEASLVVSYYRGQTWVQDNYLLDLDGALLQQVEAGAVQSGSWVAVEGELFMETPEAGGETVAAVAVKTMVHAPEWSPEVARSLRSARGSPADSPPPPQQPAVAPKAQQARGGRQQQQQQQAPQGQQAMQPMGMAMQPLGRAAPAQPKQPQQQRQAQSPPPAGNAAGDLSWLATASTEDKWQHLDEHFNGWWDNRTKKLSPKAPDFKLKVPKDSPLNVALWLTSKDTPDWVKQKYGAPVA